ncbi:S24 family peptidase [Hahella sp. HN01]|uniref:S24 family peptidase n=1 Tax=Hahella sp. HN01 TaxID=2847262 RepID=UPI001C1EC71D|nr:S24 family peptidase [Hahella sp. HN01]MBU6955992.1 helix-turn-helix domain-containing protein [Hahella sp. HN01]
MDTSNRIKQRMQALGLKAAQIVREAGVSKGAVSHWISGLSKPSGQNLIALSKVLKCDPNWLITGVESQGPERRAEWMGTVEFWEEGDPLKEDEIELPFYTEVKLSNGSGSVIKLDIHGAKLRYPIPVLKERGITPEHAACIEVKGPSMEPVLPNGTVVGIDTSNTEILDGKLYGIDHNGMPLVRLVYRTPGGGFRLKCYNVAEYPDELITGESLKHVRVLGKAFWYSVMI